MQLVDDYEEIVFHSNVDSFLEDSEEYKKEWINELLLEFGVDASEFSEDELTPMLRDSDLSILSYPSIGAVLVKYKEEIIAEWGGPTLKLKRDEKGYFYEVTIKYINYDLGEDNA
jgi:hypothetical protein